MKKLISITVLFLITIFLLSSCDDFTRNFNIFRIFNPEKTTEEKMETASYYMSKKTKSSYEKAMNIYEEIKAEDPYNSDALYGYATAYAKYNEIKEEVVSAITQVVALMADLQSMDPVTLFERLYESKEEVKQKQLSTYNIAKTVSNTLDGLSRDMDNTQYHGRVKSQDVWLDAVIAYIHRCHSTITTHDGQAEQATVLELVWDPETEEVKLSFDGLIEWALKETTERVAIVNASNQSLQNAISIFAMHTGAEELEKLNEGLEKVTDSFNDFLVNLSTSSL